MIDRIRDDVAEWRLTPTLALAIAVIPAALALSGIVTAPFWTVYKVLANEDGVVEWLQVALVLAAIPVCVHIGLLLWRADRRVLAVLYAIAAVGAIAIVGEEISWGQRLLDFETPEALEEINRQGETNFHNVGSTLKVINLVVLGVCAAAITLPILRWSWWRDRAAGLERFVLAPPLVLVPAFAFPLAYRLIRLAFIPEAGRTITKYSEFAEASFYFGLLAFAILARRALLARQVSPVPGTGASISSDAPSA